MVRNQFQQRKSCLNRNFDKLGTETYGGISSHLLVQNASVNFQDVQSEVPSSYFRGKSTRELHELIILRRVNWTRPRLANIEMKSRLDWITQHRHYTIEQ